MLAFWLLAMGAAPARAEEALSLQRQIEAAEKLDGEIAQATEELKKAPSPAERSRLEGKIRELQARQEILLDQLEEVVGPLPPRVRRESPIPLEQQLKGLERRHETTLDNDAQRRSSQ